MADITIEYAAVRAELDWTLDDDSLPTEIIQLDQFEGEADRWVNSQIPNIGDSNLAYATRAKVAYTAYLLVDGMPNVTDEREFFARQGYTREKIDIPALKAKLLDKALGAVFVANGAVPTRVTDIPPVFTLATGTRGR